MRNDEQLVNDEVESTKNALADTAKDLYDAIGPSAVLDWGYRIGLKFEPCKPCETTTPSVGDICAVCWSQRSDTTDTGPTKFEGDPHACDHCGKPYGLHLYNGGDHTCPDSNPKTWLQIVRYACGCVGSRPDANGEAHIIADCENGTAWVKPRNMHGTAWHPMPADYITTIARAMASGERYQQLRHELRTAIELDFN